MRHADVQTQPAVFSLKGSVMPAAQNDARTNASVEYQRLDAVLSLLFPSTIRVQQSQNILGHLHSLRCLTLSNSGRLLLKGSVFNGTPLLRQERFYLETEARSLALLGQSANPCIPQLYYYDPYGGPLGSPYLVRRYVNGTSLSDMEHQLTARQRADIDRHLGFLASTISQNVAPGFGSLQQVAVGAGKRAWREAFSSLFESVLRDAEDMFIHLPYAEIRHEMVRLAPALDEITLPRLVVVSFGRPSHVLLDEASRQLSGVVDFSSALWGDLLMAEIFEDPSSAVLEGAGLPLVRTKREHMRLLLYSCYRLVCQITIQYYRNRDENKEFSARRRLTRTIADMVTLEFE
ncbi:Aminoglycoside phosphotransferase [Penicillium macrosclerotiorum]|uniref:Aminoglycoside phosphotransferase n=1 Tax=Penicillium macrosclerotiorum TaxID=303699 RepID=UPI0025477FE2|nr:Aminoglycoside phosphotransferase [Penicillium macrosclerotiorum]KAJ5674107.1 Aminoglycoside phosphotransferase [Penicillium macrosclerotiorum]